MTDPKAPSSEHLLRGLPASAGIAIGRAVIVHPLWWEGAPVPPPRGDVDSETERFRHAQQVVAEELDNIAERARRESPTLSSILEAHQMIVTDPVLSADIIDRISSGVSSEAAVVHEFERQRRTLLASTNSMFRDRVSDLDHMKEQMLSALRTGVPQVRRDGESIVVADTVSPHDMLADRQLGVRGYVMQSGGIDAHSSIIARDFGVPAVVSVAHSMTRIHDGDLLIIDGSAGVVICNPGASTLEHYQRQQDDERQQRLLQEDVDHTPIHSLDGVRITIEANIDVPEQVPVALRLGAEGLGLVRSEMMIASINEIPSIDEQVRWYGQICQNAGELPITIRAFDFGGDKIDVGQTYVEDNPALGLRGIRFLLSQPDILRDQFTALLMVARERPIRCMLPMITTQQELDRALEIIAACRAAHTEAHGDCPDVPIGIMIETPAAALSAESFASQVDFFSIGTNDLTQYTLAIDRTNDLVAGISDGLHPSVLKLISMTVSAARSAGIPVTVCGEMAGQSAAIDVLVGLGVSGVSVSSFALHDVRRRVRELDAESCQRLADISIRSRTAAEVRSHIDAFRSSSTKGASS
ncbi:MAG: phosphoenolpyruvate--protein phosphotransferase [Candidatus Kapabacteria bacterium]|nr:phosphoenolpyruvate--protein phosphotransferase [Candidatus Kapabacteria bacterium]